MVAAAPMCRPGSSRSTPWTCRRGRSGQRFLDRSAGWQPTGTETISLFEPTDGAEAPWLIELAPGRFVIIATSDEQERSMLVPLRIAPDGATSLEIGPSTPSRWPSTTRARSTSTPTAATS